MFLILVTFEITIPVFKRLVSNGVENAVTENKGLFLVSMSILHLLVFPGILWVYVRGKVPEFTEAITKELSKV